MTQYDSNYEREKNDYYASPPGVFAPLLRHIPSLKDDRIWECAAGEGILMNQMITAGCRVQGTDLVDYGNAYVKPRIDFLMEYKTDCPYIVTNPPYKLAEKFVRHGLSLPSVRCVAVLVPLLFIAAKRRADLLQKLAVIIIMGRLKMLPPGAVDKGDAPKTDFAWLVYQFDPVVTTMIERHIP